MSNFCTETEQLSETTKFSFIFPVNILPAQTSDKYTCNNGEPGPWVSPDYWEPSKEFENSSLGDADKQLQGKICMVFKERNYFSNNFQYYHCVMWILKRLGSVRVSVRVYVSL